MTRPLSSRYGNPLTFNIVVMFLFYVLSVTLCLSSVSTCVCVVFNPVGTFRTVANYILYALVLSLLLTVLSIYLFLVYFDNEALPESHSTGDEKLMAEKCHEASASGDDVNATGIQEGNPKVSATHELKEATLTHEALHQVSARQEITQVTLTEEEHSEGSAQSAPFTYEAEHEQVRGISGPCLVEAPVTVIHHPIDADALTANLTPSCNGNPSPTPAAGTSRQTASADDPQKQPIEIPSPINRTLFSPEEIPASTTESLDAAELAERTPKAKPTIQTPTTSQNKPTNNNNIITTAPQSRKLDDDPLNRTTPPNANDATDADPNTPRPTTESVAGKRGPRSETRGLSPDADVRGADVGNGAVVGCGEGTGT